MTAHAIRTLIKNGEVVKAKCELDVLIREFLVEVESDCDCWPLNNDAIDLRRLFDAVHAEIRSAYTGLSGIKEKRRETCQ